MIERSAVASDEGDQESEHSSTTNDENDENDAGATANAPIPHERSCGAGGSVDDAAAADELEELQLLRAMLGLPSD
jgi:hypothetical protein